YGVKASGEVVGETERLRLRCVRHRMCNESEGPDTHPRQGIDRACSRPEARCAGGQCFMKAYTYSEARENFASVLEEAERDGAVEIRRRDGAIFRISPARRSKASPLDVKGVKLGVRTADLVAAVREGRERQ